MLTLFGCSRLRYSGWVRASLGLQSPERGVLPLRRSPGESKASWLPGEKTYTAGQKKDLDRRGPPCFAVVVFCLELF
jgi:hypothetical protein